MRTLRDKLSHLSFLQAAKLLGPRGRELIMEGGKFEIGLDEQVALDDQQFRLDVDEATVTIGLSNDKRQRFDLGCSVCHGACVHQGAALEVKALDWGSVTECCMADPAGGRAVVVALS